MVRLADTRTVTLDGNGRGVAVITAPGAKAWRIIGMSVSVPGSTVEATARIYSGLIQSDRLVDITYTAASGDASNSEHYLLPGESLLCEWTGGQPGAVAVVRFWGGEYAV